MPSSSATRDEIVSSIQKKIGIILGTARGVEVRDGTVQIKAILVDQSS